MRADASPRATPTRDRLAVTYRHDPRTQGGRQQELRGGGPRSVAADNADLQGRSGGSCCQLLGSKGSVGLSPKLLRSRMFKPLALT